MPQGNALGFGRALKRGALAGLAVAVVAALALGAWTVSQGGLPGRGDNDTTSALIVLGMPDENGDLVAQAIVRVDGVGTGAPSLVSVDPTASVTVVGTSYGHLRDAYAFGGGARVSEAYSRLWGEALPYIDFSPAAIEYVAAQEGGINVNIPADMSVFDGDTLYTFTSGPARLSATELRAALNGAAYLAPVERKALLGEVERALVTLCAAYPGGLQAAIDRGDVSTDFSKDGVAAISSACAKLP